MFGRLLASHRRRLGLTQEELADRAGVSERTIRDLEADRGRVPRPASARLLADALGLAGSAREDFLRGAAPATALTGDQRGSGTPKATPAPTPAQLPPAPTAFTGREVELATLAQRCTEGSGVLART